MLFQTTQEHEALRAKIRAFAEEEIKPIAFLLDQQNEFPEEARSVSWARWASWASPIPRSTAAPGWMPSATPSPWRNWPGLDGGAGVILSAHVSLGSWPIFAFGTEAQKQKYLVPWPRGRRSAPSASPSPTPGPTPAAQRPPPC